MNKQIRENIFETNSSSVHSFSIARDAQVYDTFYCYDDEIVNVDTAEFGRGDGEVISNANEKAAYLYTYALFYSKKPEDYIEQLRRVFKEHTKKDVVFEHEVKGHKIEDVEAYEEGYGYIDHQSVEKPEMIFKGGDYYIKEFVFNPDSILILEADG